MACFFGIFHALSFEIDFFRTEFPFKCIDMPLLYLGLFS